MVELAEGTTFAGYRIEKLAGHGGMGVVYRARHLRLDRVDALKLIAPDLADDVGFRARFERESRVAAGIDDPHVITIYHAGEEGGQLYLAMKFIEGTDLRAEISKCGRLEPGRAVGILAQVASALDAAHRNGLVHRDVKPANVLLAKQDGGDYAYLTDFGLTKRLESRGRDTPTGKFVGTVDYIAPEQVRGRRVDARADVYSLGCVLYHLLTGQVPYPREHDIATAMAQVEEDPPSLQELRPELAQRFDPVIHKAMAKDPGDRYESAGDLASAGQAVFAAKTVPSPQGSVATGEAAPTKTQVRVPPPPPPQPPGWYREPGRGQTRWWTGSEWGPAEAPGTGVVGVPPPPGWYREPDTERMRWWTGSEWGDYQRSNGGNRHWLRWALAVVALAGVIVIAVAIAAGGGTPTTTPPPPTNRQPPPTPQFLANSVNSGGTAPQQKGAVVANGQTLPNSLLYTIDISTTADSPQSVTYNLGGRYGTFTATIGLDKCSLDGMSATFQVRADGTNIANRNVPAGTNVPISAPIGGRNQLQLLVWNNMDLGGCGEAVWGRAEVK